MKRKLIITTAALLFSGSAALALASGYGGHGFDGGFGKGGYGHGEHGRHQGGGMGPRMLNKLDWELGLSAEQRDQIRELMRNRQDQAWERREQMRELHQSMRDLDPGAADYQQQVASLAKQQGELVSQGVLERAEIHGAIHEMLTAEQRQRFEQLQERRKERRDERQRPRSDRW